MPISRSATRSAGGFAGYRAPQVIGDGFLSWSAVSGASGYNVYWDTVGGPPYANVVDVGNVTSADQGDFTGLGTGTRYFNITSYQVGAGDAKNEGPWGTEITVVVA